MRRLSQTWFSKRTSEIKIKTNKCKRTKNVPWHVAENENNIDDALMTWNKLFSEGADDHVPVKCRCAKGTPLPWMNRKISDSMRERNWSHRKARKSNTVRH